MEVRRSGYVLEYALVVTDGAERALVAAQGDRGMAFRFLDAAGAPVISSRIPAHGVKAVRASDGAVDRFSLTGVEPCSETEFRRIAGWELVATPR